jgi:thiol peroxidase
MFDPLSGSEDYWNTKLHLSMQTRRFLPAVGGEAPAFCLVNSELKNVSLANYAGKYKILNILPSLDIPSCMAVTRKFNQKRFCLENTITLTISADLPFTQQRLYEISGLRDIATLSTFRATFAEDYGVEIISGHLAGLMAQAVVVLDEQNKVIYTELLPELNQALNYEAIFAALKHSDGTVVLQQLSEPSSDDISDIAILQPGNRRECFRIGVPITNPCYCKILLPVPKEDATVEYKCAYELAINKIQNRIDDTLKKQHRVTKTVTRNKDVNYCMQIDLHDVSASGCSMVNYDEEFSYFLMPHTIYDNCTVFIPNYGEVKVNLKIMSKRKADSILHGFNELIGITFIGMEQSVEVAISSYVQDIERQRISVIKKHSI